MGKVTGPSSEPPQWVPRPDPDGDPWDRDSDGTGPDRDYGNYDRVGLGRDPGTWTKDQVYASLEQLEKQFRIDAKTAKDNGNDHLAKKLEGKVERLSELKDDLSKDRINPQQAAIIRDQLIKS